MERKHLDPSQKQYHVANIRTKHTAIPPPKSDPDINKIDNIQIRIKYSIERTKEKKIDLNKSPSPKSDGVELTQIFTKKP